MTTHLYRNLGLTVASDIPLPGMTEAPAGPVDVEVEVVRGRDCPQVGSPWEMVDPPRTAWRAPAEEGSRLRLQFLGDDGQWAEFEVSGNGKRVAVRLREDVDLGEAVQLLMGSVFSCVLAHRGTTCVHASVVAQEGRAIAFVGPKGTGKSTLALACIQQGAQLVSDDVAAISSRDGVIAVEVGAPQLRLRADSATLTGSYDELRPIWTTTGQRPPKRYHDVADDLASETLPLVRICVLSPRGGRSVEARDLTPGELLPRLHAMRHMAALLDRECHRRDFACLAALVERVPGIEVERPDDLASAAAVARMVLSAY